MTRKIFKIIFVVSLFLSFHFVFSADLYLAPQNVNVNVGDNFSLNVYVDSSDQAMNAVSFRISYPTNLLRVNSVSKTGSIMNFWVQEPTYGDGEVYTEAVVMNPGFNGNRGKVLTINFKALNPGTAEIRFLSGSVLANDGYGTNILKNLTGSTVKISQKVVEIEEETTIFKGNPPSSPKIFSLTHQDEEKWYKLDSGSVSWEYKEGENVKFVELDIYHNDKLINTTRFSSDVKNYNFQNLDNGKWEFRATAINDYGKSKPAIYKVQIDKEIPQLTIYEVSRSDLAFVPEFQFSVFDGYSGFDYLEISIDGKPSFISRDFSYRVSGIEPGVHKILVKAFDKAGNFTSLEKEFYIKEKIEVVKNIRDIYYFIIGILVLILIILIFEIYRLSRIRKHLKDEIINIDTTISKAFKELRKHVIKHLHYLEEIKNTRELSDAEKKILEELTKDLEETENIIKKELEE